MTRKIAGRKKITPKYQQIFDINDDKINILLLGTSGSGKSTLINSILETNEALTGVGEAVTNEIAIYQNDVLPFRMIDTVGYEYNIFKQNNIKRDLTKFCKEGVKKQDVEKLIHMIWFCIDGTVKRIDQSVLNYVKSVSNDWKNVPILAVITKSYSEAEIEENIKMVDDAFEKYNLKHSKKPLNYKKAIPVVAESYKINDSVIVPQMGLDALIDETNKLAPQAKKISKDAIKSIDLNMKSSMANSIVATSTLAATAIGAIPFTIPDATLLVPLQTSMLWGTAKTYGIKKDDISSEIIDKIIEIGATTLVGKSLLNLLKAIPGINIAAAVLNGAVAGVITFAAGETSKIIFEKIYKGEIDPKATDWEKEVAKYFEKYGPMVISKIEEWVKNNKDKIDIKNLAKLLSTIIEQIQNVK